MSTNTGGGAGSGPGGGSGTGPRIVAAYDFLMSRVDAAMTRLADAVLHSDRVVHSDAGTSIDDLRIAWHLAEGRDVAELDRNGWPVTS